MIQKYPVGIQDFGELRTGGYLYVDKTEYVYRLATEGKYYFLSRPRRFGKSLLISTLESLFLSKRELFEGLYIEDKWDWTQCYPIIRISFSNIGHKEKGLYQAIDDQLDKIAESHAIVLTESVISGKFKELIEQLSVSRGKVVVLIDEYDKPIIDYLGDETAKAIENRDVMKIFYSILKDADPHLKLVFITGVSKFSRVSIFSDLNNLNDITTDYRFAGSCGITEDELEINFVEELKEFDRKTIKEWYNGYSWDIGVSVYNPFSLLNFFTKRKFQNFWFETGTPTFLIKLAEKGQLYNFEEIEVGGNALSSYDIQKLEIIPLMFQTGYLTMKSYSEMSDVYVLGYPNKEVRKSYIEVLMSSYSHSDLGFGVVYVDKIRQYLEKGEIERVESILNTIFKSLPYELWQGENEHFYHAIIHLTFTLLGVYVQSEVQTSDGRMDALIRLKDYVYCIEFKLDESATKAIEQIKAKGYLTPFAYEGKKLIAIGINFSREKKKVEELKWEEVNF
ncbi:ATP-binding protein [Flectobacillus roseus]|uniref:AAA family ATPase n=1 Tax=Flectobacillus roseus TaxID=502259 RepID=A0ABT6Y879_9BACT|nr:ATP-binding protein [Flectobacillus roseus]MDI9859760.1 AAA family ATPase [Flectobacillus roseus]